MLGLLLINKPSGITSFGAVARIKRLTGEKRIGHTGTLDPMATGVLPIFIGRATVLSSYLLLADKEYKGRARLGLTTDTLDITGKVIKTANADLSPERLREILNSFSGVQMQTPPVYSALKVKGERLYNIARKGEKVDIPPRQVEIKSINLLAGPDDKGEFSFETTVSKGTYIRSLVRDIGEKAGSGATLTELVRTKTAGFKLCECVSLDELTEDNITEYLLPPDMAVEHFPAVKVTEKQATRFNNGGQLDLDRIPKKSTENGGILRVYGPEGFLGLGAVDREKNQLTIKCLV